MRHLWRSLSDLYRHVLKHDVFVLAAAIGYTVILSLFPLLIGLIAMLGQFVDEAKAQQAVVGALAPHLPPEAVGLVWATLDAAIRARGTAGAAAGAVLLWTASAAAGILRHSLNRVLGAPRARAFWHRKAIELTMVLVVGTLLSLSLLVSGITALVESVPALAAITRAVRQSPLAAAAARVGPWVLSTAAFVVVYRFLPNVRVGWRSLLTGSLTAAVLFETAKQAFFWYLRTLARYPIVYGPLAGVVVFMVWIYLAALVFLVGAEVAGHVERGMQPLTISSHREGPRGDADR